MIEESARLTEEKRRRVESDLEKIPALNGLEVAFTHLRQGMNHYLREDHQRAAKSMRLAYEGITQSCGDFMESDSAELLVTDEASRIFNDVLGYLVSNPAYARKYGNQQPIL